MTREDRGLQIGRHVWTSFIDDPIGVKFVHGETTKLKINWNQFDVKK